MFRRAVGLAVDPRFLTGGRWSQIMTLLKGSMRERMTGGDMILVPGAANRWILGDITEQLGILLLR